MSSPVVAVILFLMMDSIFSAAPGLYPFKLDLNIKEYEIRLSWYPDYETSTVSFAVELSSMDRLKWMAVGFSDHGSYHLADLCVVMGGEIIDSYTDKDGAIRPDGHQDCTDDTQTEHPDGRLTVTFNRRFDTMDTFDMPIQSGTTQLMFLLGTSDRTNVDGDDVLRTIVPNRLLRALKPAIILDDDVIEMDVTVGNASVPARETTYWCAVARLPPSVIDVKHHMIKYEKRIQRGNEDVVHHMEVYRCVAPSGGGATMSEPLFNGDCTQGQQLTDESRTCRKVIAAWARGAEPMVYPEEAGAPIGGYDFFPYLMLEIHYNNPQLRKGIIDDSGIRLYVTPNLRQHDASIMELGLIYSDTMAIPPGVKNFPLRGYCTSECTEQGLPPDGINIFASQLHAHLTGAALSTVHIRNGVQINVVNQDANYSPDWQEIRPLVEPVNVMPGDALVTTCAYNSETRKAVTLVNLPDGVFVLLAL